MIWLPVAFFIGLIAAGILSALVFRAHSEWAWMKPKKACITCEVPRSPADVVPILGDMKMAYRCRNCKAFIPWQYPVIEAAIVLLTMFHIWRFVTGTWIPMVSDELLWLVAARDIVFTLFLITIFVYDLKYQLIMDQYTIPAMVVALAMNIALGVSGYELVLAMAVLFVFFLIQYVFSKGRILGAGDVRMGLVIGAMLGFVHGIGAVLLAYVIGAIVGGVLLLAKTHGPKDHVPFGTFLSVATFVFLVWGDVIVSWVL